MGVHFGLGQAPDLRLITCMVLSGPDNAESVKGETEMNEINRIELRRSEVAGRLSELAGAC